MKKITEDLLYDAWDYCNIEEKSTEFMIQYMQDYANVSLEVVLQFLHQQAQKERR